MLRLLTVGAGGRRRVGALSLSSWQSRPSSMMAVAPPVPHPQCFRKSVAPAPGVGNAGWRGARQPVAAAARRRTCGCGGDRSRVDGTIASTATGWVRVNVAPSVRQHRRRGGRPPLLPGGSSFSFGRLMSSSPPASSDGAMVAMASPSSEDLGQASGVVEDGRDEGDGTRGDEFTGGDNSGGGLLRLLTDEQAALLDEQRRLSRRAGEVTMQLRIGIVGEASVGGDHGGEDGTSSTAPYEDSMFSIVVAGEFNAGKSTVINALLGRKLLDAGPLPTTDVITIISGAGNTATDADADADADGQADTTKAAAASRPRPPQPGTAGPGTVVHHLLADGSIDLLKDDLVLVDTPGTNAVAAGHEFKTRRYLPTADLILFVVSADKPFAESERAFLQSIQKFRKQIVVLVNKMDVLESLGPNYGEVAKANVMDYVTTSASSLLGMRPVVFPVSARQALEAKVAHAPTSSSPSYGPGSAAWKRSGFDELQNFLVEELTDESKVRSKLINPLSVAEATATEALGVVERREGELDTDVAALALLEDQARAWVSDLREDAAGERSVLTGELAGRAKRCREWIRGMGPWRQFSLVFGRDAAGRFEEEWMRSVVVAERDALDDTVELVARETSEIVTTKARAQSEAVIQYLGKRPAAVDVKMVGNVTTGVPSSFEETRRTLNDKLKRAALDVLAGYEPRREAWLVWRSLRGTVLASSALGAGAGGMGVSAALGLLEPMHASVAFAVLAVSGALVLPLRNRTTSGAFDERIDGIIERLEGSLSDVSDREIDRLNRKILDGIGPYTRFVQTERDRMQRMRTECEDILAESHALRGKITKLCN